MTATTSFVNGNTTLEVNDNCHDPIGYLDACGRLHPFDVGFRAGFRHRLNSPHLPATDADASPSRHPAGSAMSQSTGLTTLHGAADQFAFQGQVRAARSPTSRRSPPAGRECDACGDARCDSAFRLPRYLRAISAMKHAQPAPATPATVPRRHDARRYPRRPRRPALVPAILSYLRLTSATKPLRISTPTQM